VAKEAAVDAVYFWTKVQPFSAEVAGAVTLKVASDRESELKLGDSFNGAKFALLRTLKGWPIRNARLDQL
jgi:hypothetical protein